MAIVRPPKHPHPDVQHVLHRVRAVGDHHAMHRHEGETEDAAHEAAVRLSKEHPLAVVHVYGVPKMVPASKQGHVLTAGNQLPLVPNEGDRYESVIAEYRGGVEVPIT